MWEYTGKETQGCGKCGKQKTYDVLSYNEYKVYYLNGVRAFAFKSVEINGNIKWVPISFKEVELYDAPLQYHSSN